MTRRKESKSVLDDKTETIPHTGPVFINPNGYKTQVKATSDVSAETRRQINAYNPISNEAAGLRKEIHENQELKGNKRPIPAKRHVAKDNAKTVSKCNEEGVKSSKHNPVGVNDTEVRDEQTEQSNEYLEPVSNRSSLEEPHNYIDLQQETDDYDYIDPNYVPDTLS